MRKTLILAATTVALAGCQMTQSQQEEMTGAIAGAAFGLITAKALGASNDWALVVSLAGAAAGVLVARNTRTGQCAYSNGDGTYYTAACP
ncbi:MAG: glucose-6-phosphate isomerase [Brevirhabdus sp.]